MPIYKTNADSKTVPSGEVPQTPPCTPVHQPMSADANGGAGLLSARDSGRPVPVTPLTKVERRALVVEDPIEIECGGRAGGGGARGGGPGGGGAGACVGRAQECAAPRRNSLSSAKSFDDTYTSAIDNVEQFFRSENEFVDHFRTGVEAFVKRLKVHADVGRPILSPSNIDRLFLDYESLFTLNVSSLASLAKLRADGKETLLRGVGSHVVELVPFMKMYASFIASYRGRIQAAEKLRSKKSAFRDFLEISERVTGNSITFYLKLPTLKFVAYLKFLCAIFDAIPPEEHSAPFAQHIMEAIKLLKQLGEEITKKNADTRARRKVFELDRKLFGGQLDIVTPNRKVIEYACFERVYRSGALASRLAAFKKTCSKGGGRGSSSGGSGSWSGGSSSGSAQGSALASGSVKRPVSTSPCYVVLFNDLLVCGSKARWNEFKCHLRGNLEHVTVETLPKVADYPFDFQLELGSPNETCVLKFPDQETYAHWYGLIASAVQAARNQEPQGPRKSVPVVKRHGTSRTLMPVRAHTATASYGRLPHVPTYSRSSTHATLMSGARASSRATDREESGTEYLAATSGAGAKERSLSYVSDHPVFSTGSDPSPLRESLNSSFSASIDVPKQPVLDPPPSDEPPPGVPSVVPARPSRWKLSTAGPIGNGQCHTSTNVVNAANFSRMHHSIGKRMGDISKRPMKMAAIDENTNPDVNQATPVTSTRSAPTSPRHKPSSCPTKQRKPKQGKQRGPLPSWSPLNIHIATPLSPRGRRHKFGGAHKVPRRGLPPPPPPRGNSIGGAPPPPPVRAPLRFQSPGAMRLARAQNQKQQQQHAALSKTSSTAPAPVPRQLGVHRFPPPPPRHHALPPAPAPATEEGRQSSGDSHPIPSAPSLKSVPKTTFDPVASPVPAPPKVPSPPPRRSVPAAMPSKLSVNTSCARARGKCAMLSRAHTDGPQIASPRPNCGRSALLRDIQGRHFSLRKVEDIDGADGRRRSVSDGATPWRGVHRQFGRPSSYHEGIMRDVRKVLDEFSVFMADEPDSTGSGSDWSDGE